MNRKIITIITIVLFTGAAIWLYIWQQSGDVNEQSSAANEQTVSTVESVSQPQSSDEELVEPEESGASLAAGRYAEYDDSALRAEGYSTSVLFFHASWCPECRAFEQMIQAEGVPEGVQILKVDYDSSQDLRSKYGVTVQTTFVRVDSDGNLLGKWVGYGEDKSVNAIVENTA